MRTLTTQETEQKIKNAIQLAKDNPEYFHDGFDIDMIEALELALTEIKLLKENK